MHEPYQMLGWIDPDLQAVLGLDVEGCPAAETLFGFRNENWKPWRLDDGTEVLVRAIFRRRRSANGDTLIYPKGDHSAPPSGRLPKGGYLFRQHRPPGAPSTKRSSTPRTTSRNSARSRRRTSPIIEPSANGCRGAPEAGRHRNIPRHGLRRHRPRSRARSSSIRRASATSRSGTSRPSPGRTTSPRSSSASARSPLKNLERLADLFGDRIEWPCSSAAPTSAPSAGRSSRPPPTASSSSRSTSGSTSWVHAPHPWKTFIHSCGSVGPSSATSSMPGFDILNPVQCSAADMDPGASSAKFGERLVFWGGGVDTQKTLPFGTPEEVCAEVPRTHRHLRQGRRVRLQRHPQHPGPHPPSPTKNVGVPTTGRDRRRDGASQLGEEPERLRTPRPTTAPLAEYYKLGEGQRSSPLRSWMDVEWHRDAAEKVKRSDIHRLIVQLGSFPVIYTTNYDRYLELAHECMRGEVHEGVEHRRAGRGRPGGHPDHEVPRRLPGRLVHRPDRVELLRSDSAWKAPST